MSKINSDNGELNQEVINSFWAQKSKERRSRWTSNSMLDFEVAYLERFLKKDKEQNVLDLGCGDGELSKKLVGNFHRLTAVDYQEGYGRFFLRLAKGGFVRSRVSEFSSNSRYELILLFGVITHLTIGDELKTLDVISNHLADEGTAVIKHQCSEEGSFVVNGYSDHLQNLYSARYPGVKEQVNRLSRFFFVSDVIKYPNHLNSHIDSAHYMFICRAK